MSVKKSLSLQKYKQVRDREEVFVPLYRQLRLGCCDCGLVHHVEFTIYKNGKPIKRPSHQGYRISMRPTRSNEDSAINRSERNFKCRSK